MRCVVNDWKIKMVCRLRSYYSKRLTIFMIEGNLLAHLAIIYTIRVLGSR